MTEFSVGCYVGAFVTFLICCRPISAISLAAFAVLYGVALHYATKGS